MPDTISDLASRLAENAEAVCRHYLPNGKRTGAYWCVGDVHGAPGRSLYVRLHGPSSGKGAAGRWADAATGEHGNLLDLIHAVRNLGGLADALEEARYFLGRSRSTTKRPIPYATNAAETARRLWDAGRPFAGTLPDIYLRARGIQLGLDDMKPLRFHPRCYYRADEDDHVDACRTWPALMAIVTATNGDMTGIQRIWIDPAHHTKAPVATPHRALGPVRGNAVRFGVVDDVMAVGEGIETVLSLRCALPSLPLAAALSAGNLGSFLPPPELRRLYVAADNDEAGWWAANRLRDRMAQAGIDVIALVPRVGDFNDDLRELGPDALAANLRGQLAPEDVARFWRAPEGTGRTG